MHPHRSLLRLRQGIENQLAGSIAATVAQQIRQDDPRGHGHAGKRTHRVEGLREVEPARGGLLAAQRKDEGVGGGFEEGQTEGQDVQRQTEEEEALVRGRRDEEERAHRIQRKPQQDAALVAEAPDEERRGDGHRGVSAVEGELDQGRLGGGELHDRLETRHHRVGDVVGEAPEGEERRDKDERQQILPFNQFRSLIHYLYSGPKLAQAR